MGGSDCEGIYKVFQLGDAIHHIKLEACHDGRSHPVGSVEPGERAAKVPEFI